MNTRKANKTGGFSLLELLAVVTILGIIAAIIVPRVTVSSDAARTQVRDHHKATINAAVERFYVDTGSWPAADLSNMVPPATFDYFPDGVPTDPVTGGTYTLNTTTNRVN